LGESISGGSKKEKLKNALSSDMSSMLRHSKGECGLCRMGQKELGLPMSFFLSPSG